MHEEIRAEGQKVNNKSGFEQEKCIDREDAIMRYIRKEGENEKGKK